MPTTTLMPLPKQQYLTVLGTPLVGGKVYTYSAGSTTPKATYSDAAGTTPQANPITLNLRGEPPSTIFWSGNYRVDVRDALGNLIYSVDNYNTDPYGVANFSGANGGANVGVNYGDGTQNTDVQTLIRQQVAISPERFFIAGESDSGPSLQRAIDYGIANSVNVVGLGKYISSTPLVIRQYRLDPAVNQDFSAFNFTLNQLTYTGITGSAISAASSTASVYVKKLIGPGPAAGATSGLYITGQGDAMHRVDWVTGFQTNINMELAYSHTVYVGYCNNAITGVRINGNAIKLLAGRIGGQYTDGDTAIDLTSCDIGVDIVNGTANEIKANIEYCRRTANSICLRDAGEANIFTGYLEGANAYNLYAIGRGGTFNLVAGNNKLAMPAAVFAENDNKIEFLSQQVQDQVVPTGANSTLAFETPTQMFTYGFAEISGRQGYRERCIPSSPASDPVNQILTSNDLNSFPWSQSVIGTANWSDVTRTSNVAAYPEAGYKNGTRFVFPAKAGYSDIYVVTQSSRTLRPGQVSYGMLMRVAAGEVDIQVRILNPDTGRQSKNVVRLKASNKWINVAARITEQTGVTTNAQLDIQFRTLVGATVDIANVFLVNEPVSYLPPANPTPTARTGIKGLPIDGNTFENGANFNGPVRQQMSPAIASASQYLIGDYPIVMVTGGWEGNLFLQASQFGSGHRFTLMRDGVAASGSGTMQILPDATTVNGSAAAISIAPAYTVIDFIWSAAVNGWVKK